MSPGNRINKDKSMTYNIVRAEMPRAAIGAAEMDAVRSHLERDGWALLRGFKVDMSVFSALTAVLPHDHF